MKYCIYALVDPRDLRVRYIGQTYNPKRRQYRHCCLTSSSASKLVKAWVRELRNLDLTPQLVVFQQVDIRAEALRVEAHWIRQFLAEGAALLNRVGRPKRKKLPRREAAFKAWDTRRKNGTDGRWGRPSRRDAQRATQHSTL
jgi:hypothetical protein